jgi:diaminopimelate decarboxylase
VTLFKILPSLRHTATPPMDRAIWPLTTRVDEQGRLCVGDIPLAEIADKFGTPTYVIDEADFRQRIRRYRTALPEVRFVYAGKALLTTGVARWVAEEGVGLAVRSGGELATALVAGVDPNQIVMHGNASTPGELCKAGNVGVGRIIVDHPGEVALLATVARQPQSVQVRVSQDTVIAGGHTTAAVERILDQPQLRLVGLQCNVGSQVTDAGVYGDAIRRMVRLMAEVRSSHGVIMIELNIGGGHGIPYVSGDPELDLEPLRDLIDDALDESCGAARFPRPTVVVEPGRAISARAGVTLYRVLWVQPQPGGRTAVVVDGGLGDNPQAAISDTGYNVALANRRSNTSTQPMTVVGRHGESGDEIAREVPLPADLRAGDLLAAACTGAYHHSMASNYNMVGRPPVVAVKDGCARELMRRETIADLLSRDRAGSFHGE